MNEQQYEFRLKLKYDYAAWANQILQGRYDRNHWRGYFVSFMFKHIRGSIEQRFSVMEDEIDRVYATLVRHAVRDSNSPSQRRKLPILYAFPDYPFRSEEVKVNDGLHYHGILLSRTDTRLGRSLENFVKRNKEAHFIKPDKGLRDIWIGRIEETPERMVGYGLKAIERRIPDSNRMVILPKSWSELSGAA